MGSESWSEVSIFESLPRYGTKRDFPLANEKRRFVETQGNVKSSFPTRVLQLGNSDLTFVLECWAGESISAESGEI